MTKYRSTRGNSSDKGFEEVVLGGLAEDGGLYVPITIPTLSLEEIENMRGLSFSELAFELISLYVPPEEIPREDLKNIIDKSFVKFRHPDITPSVQCGEFWILELFHGPTFAFKDLALQFLGNLFEYFLLRGRIQSSITILGATSGDTGSAGIHGLCGKANINCFIMFPTDKITEIQRKQMTTVKDDNIHCMSIDGNFDDCQSLVKAAFADTNFRSAVKLGAINSINWARILVQIIYYFHCYYNITTHMMNKEMKQENQGNQTKTATNTSTDNTTTTAINNNKIKIKRLIFAVPTGNFGDILAGFYAKQMGLSIEKLVICTNENNILDNFIKTGEYKCITAIATIAPSMDISISSNFERYLYYLFHQNTSLLLEYMLEFQTTGRIQVSKEALLSAREIFTSYTATEPIIIQTMRRLYEIHNYLVCPHTATAVSAIHNLLISTSNTSTTTSNSDNNTDITVNNSMTMSTTTGTNTTTDTTTSNTTGNHENDDILVCLATAHPGKFQNAVTLALEAKVQSDRMLAAALQPPSLPTELEELFNYPEKLSYLSNSLVDIQRYIRERI